MTKLPLISFISLVVFTSYVSNPGFVRALTTWAKTQPYKHESKTVLQFYFHDNVTGNAQTVALIAQPIQANNTTSPLGFGSLYMADDPLTEGPDPSSKLVGRAQGFWGTASQEGINFIMGLTYGFVDGAYNGSTVVIFGRNSIMDPVRELPVVGGTGVFRMARGYAVAHTYFFDQTAMNAIVGYNVTIFHP